MSNLFEDTELAFKRAYADLDLYIASLTQRTLKRLRTPQSYSIRGGNEQYNQGWLDGFKRCLAELQRTQVITAASTDSETGVKASENAPDGSRLTSKRKQA